MNEFFCEICLGDGDLKWFATVAADAEPVEVVEIPLCVGCTNDLTGANRLLLYAIPETALS